MIYLSSYISELLLFKTVYNVNVPPVTGHEGPEGE